MSEEEKKIIQKVFSTINTYISPYAYYYGADVQEILLDAAEELLADSIGGKGNEIK